MKRYVALLRGINVGGKNMIAMSELKAGFVELGYTEVCTHLNSGNVIFSSESDDTTASSSAISAMIKSKFELDIPIFIVSQIGLNDILSNAPDWWGDTNKDIYDNLIFLSPSLSYDEFCSKAGNLNEQYEKAQNYKNAIFWSFSRKDYQKTNWWPKTAGSGVSSKITIRTANTVRKIVGM